MPPSSTTASPPRVSHALLNRLGSATRASAVRSSATGSSEAVPAGVSADASSASASAATGSAAASADRAGSDRRVAATLSLCSSTSRDITLSCSSRLSMRSCSSRFSRRVSCTSSSRYRIFSAALALKAVPLATAVSSESDRSSELPWGEPLPISWPTPWTEAAVEDSPTDSPGWLLVTAPPEGVSRRGAARRNCPEVAPVSLPEEEAVVATGSNAVDSPAPVSRHTVARASSASTAATSAASGTRRACPRRMRFMSPSIKASGFSR